MRNVALALTALGLAACGGGAAGGTDAGSSGDDASLGSDATMMSSDGGAPDARPDAFASDASDAADASDASDASSDATTPCYANDDCVGGACQYAATVCTPTDAGTDCLTSFACPGTCVPFAGDGSFCLAGSPPECAPDSGLLCDPFSHRCVPPSQETIAVVNAGGDPCGLGVGDCASSLFCYTPVFPNDGICLPVAEDGGACDPSNPFGGCAAGLTCVGFGSALDAGACMPPSPVGGACLAGSGGSGNSGCATGALCVDGGCAALPSMGPCLEGRCDSDAGYCDSTSTCVPWVANGAACDASAQCASSLCASTTNTCVTSLPLGAACGSTPYDCTQGVCSGSLGCASSICDVTGHCATSECSRDAGR